MSEQSAPARAVPVFDSSGSHVHDVDVEDLDQELETGQYSLHVDLDHRTYLRLKHEI
jgi:hypothetical protein